MLLFQHTINYRLLSIGGAEGLKDNACDELIVEAPQGQIYLYYDVERQTFQKPERKVPKRVVARTGDFVRWVHKREYLQMMREMREMITTRLNLGMLIVPIHWPPGALRWVALQRSHQMLRA